MSDLLNNPLPRNDEAERMVLGCSLLDNGVIPQAIGELSMEDFHSEPNRRCYIALRELHAQGRTVDPFTLQNELTKMGALEAIGGPAFIATLIDGVPRFSNIAEYVRLVKENSMKRKAINLGRWLIGEANDPETRTEDLLQMLRDKSQELEDCQMVDDLISSEMAVDRTMAQLEERWESGREVIGLTTGYSDLDRAILGLRGGKYYCLAAGTGIGKTAFALNIANNIIENNPEAAGLIISLEMGVDELTTRQLSTATRIDSYCIETGKLSTEDKQFIREKAAMIKRVPVEYVEGFSKVTASSLLSRVQKVRRKHKRIDFLIVDYLQLLDDEEKRENEHARITAISRTLKRIAITFNIPVIILSQLSRAHASRPNKDYILSDLRGSGSIEQDSDVVMFLMPEDWTNPDDPGRRLFIAKHRGGKKDITVNFVFFGNQYRFESAANGQGFYIPGPEPRFPAMANGAGNGKQYSSGDGKKGKSKTDQVREYLDEFGGEM